MAGRGWGKTRTGTEWITQRWRDGQARRIALIAPTPADARDVMIEGESGLLHTGHPNERPAYEPSKRRLTWPRDGGAEPAIATVYSGFDPEQLRGPQHDTAWGDEIAIWERARPTFDNLMLGLRLGDDPKLCLTTTPKPIALLRELVRRKDVQVTRGTTYENIQNLAPTFQREIISKYEGTTLGQQELYAMLLEEAEGALWKRAMIQRAEELPALLRILVAIDPAVTAREESNETGIVAGGIDRQDRCYVLADRSGRFGPDGWARQAIGEYDARKADRVVYEANQGGDLVAHTLLTVRKNLPVLAVNATVSKRARAEPIAALYEQGKVLHVGVFEELEDQMCSWEPLSGVPSPDRLDALVWLVTALTEGISIGAVDGEALSLIGTSYWRR